MGKTKAPKEDKQPVVFTRKQIAWATTKIVLFVTAGIIIGVVATNMVHNTVDTAVVKQVTQLKANQ